MDGWDSGEQPSVISSANAVTLLARSTAEEKQLKAITSSRYGSPDELKLEEIDKPIVEDDQVLVLVRAASINAYDWHVMRGLPDIARLAGSGLGFGLSKPKSNVDLPPRSLPIMISDLRPVEAWS